MSEPIRSYEDPEALRKQINAARRVSFFIHTSTHLVTEFDEDGKPTRGYSDMPSNVPVSAAVAMKWCADHARFASSCEEGGKPRPKVEVTKYDTCWFLG